MRIDNVEKIIKNMKTKEVRKFSDGFSETLILKTEKKWNLVINEYFTGRTLKDCDNLDEIMNIITKFLLIDRIKQIKER